MYRLTEEAVLTLAASYFAGHPGLAMLPRTGLDARRLMEVINALFGRQPNLMVMNARYEIGERLVERECLSEACADHEKIVLHSYAVMGRRGAFVDYGPFYPNDRPDAAAALSEALDRLGPPGRPDFHALAACSPINVMTIAALTIGDGPDGRLLAHLHRIPLVGREAARTFLAIGHRRAPIPL